MGKFISGLDNASNITLESLTLPSHPDSTYVKYMSKSQTANTFWHISDFLERNAVALLAGA